MGNFIHAEGQVVINTEHLCYVELTKNKVAFFFDTMTARKNWEFETEEKAKEAYSAILENIKSIQVSTK